MLRTGGSVKHLPRPQILGKHPRTARAPANLFRRKRNHCGFWGTKKNNTEKVLSGDFYKNRFVASGRYGEKQDKG